MRIIVDDGFQPTAPDTGLVRLLVRANAIRDQLLLGACPDYRDGQAKMRFLRAMQSSAGTALARVFRRFGFQ